MITAAPFPFMNLAAGQRPEELAKAHDERPGDDAGRGGGRNGKMAFTPFGPDPQAASESGHLYTADDLAKAVDEARRLAGEETEAELRVAFADDLERRRVDLLGAIRDQLDRHQSAFENEIKRLAGLSQGLALALGEALIPRALEKQPLADIGDVLRVTLSRLANEPSIELRLPASLIESSAALLDDIAKETGFPGEIVTIADAALGPADVELRWRGGVVERSADRLQAEARDLVERWLRDVPDADDQLETLSPATASESETSAIRPDQAVDPGSEHE